MSRDDEAVDDLTIVGPVVRKCDDVKLAFLFGGGNQIVHRTEISQGSGHYGVFPAGTGRSCGNDTRKDGRPGKTGRRPGRLEGRRKES